MQTNVSEVAQLRQRVAAEYMAAKLGFQGLNVGTARHDFITARQERIAALHEQLQGLVGDEAIALVAETLTDLSEVATRSDVLTVLRYELEYSPETDQLCDHLQEAWRTVDTLANRFGGDLARKLILAPSPDTNPIGIDRKFGRA